jgi:PIN domain nuclease of toxin-antitoxin system
MGRYLLDTHTAIWFFNGADSLSEAAGRIIRDLSNSIYLSVISAWEMAIKINIGKLRFPELPIKTAHLAALAEKMTLISADENIRRYDVPLVW